MKPTRATLVSDPFQTVEDKCWRVAAGVILEGQRSGGVILVLGDHPKDDLKRGDTVNARYEAGEWRVV